ncbi:MAG: serine/threonine protein phosphatase, partial [Pseudomonadota bacterium]
AMVQFLEDPSVGHVWLEYGGLETLHSYGVHCVRSSADTASFEQARDELDAALPDSHRAFLDQLEVSVEYGDYFFVHAGVKPGVPLEEQQEEDMLWIRDEFLRADSKPEKVIVYGHTPSESPVDKSWRIGVDTGAYMTGRLTAVALQGRDRYFISTE